MSKMIRIKQTDPQGCFQSQIAINVDLVLRLLPWGPVTKIELVGSDAMLFTDETVDALANRANLLAPDTALAVETPPPYPPPTNSP